MAKKDQNSNNIVDLLKAGHFGDAGVTTPDSGDPVMETMLVLTLDELAEFDRNPRRAPNAEYEALKASYLKTGADKTLLVVTRRPGEDRYFPAAGGNTRIRVLKELWKLTGNEKYYRVNCKFIPYTDDHRIMVDHLTENDNRAGYIFIDRASTVCTLFDEMGRVQDGPLSQRAFLEKLVELGHPRVSRAQLLRFRYAVELYELIPQALDAGMHARAVMRLQETHDRMKAFLTSVSSGDPAVAEEFTGCWEWILPELDDPEGIDIDTLTGRLLETLAPTAGKRLPDLDMDQVSARLKHLWSLWREDPSLQVSLRDGTAARPDRHDASSAGPVRRYSEEERTDFARENGHADSPDRPANPDSSSALRSDDGVHSRAPAEAGHAIPPGPEGSGLFSTIENLKRPGPESSPNAGKAHPSDLPSGNRPLLEKLQEKAYQYALSVAESWDIDALVASTGTDGFGYYIDIPMLESSLQVRAITAWWLLWDLSGLADHSTVIPSYLDNELKDSLIADWYRQVAAGKASVKREELNSLPPQKREEVILTAFRHLLESSLPRTHDHARFLMDLDPSQYGTFFSLLNTLREMRNIYDPET